jgi:hypothetical protein
LLYILAEQDLKSLIEATIRIDPHVDTNGDRYGPPIRIALKCRHYDAPGALLTPSPASGFTGSPALLVHPPNDSSIRSLISTYYYYYTLGGKSAASVLSFFFQWGEESDAITLLRSGRFDPNDNIPVAMPRSPLSIAVQRSYPELVRFLLDKPNVDPNRKDRFGLTPLAIAAKEGRWSIVQLLVGCVKVDVNSQCTAGR